MTATSAHRSLRDALLAGLIDYAGLFPPAELAMDAAVAEYARARQGDDAPALARFIVPARRLQEFSAAAGGHRGWPLSVLLGNDVAGDLALLARFTGADPAAAPHRADAVELRAATVAEVHERLALVPAALARFVEIPIAEDPAALVQAIGAHGAAAKFRLGGVVAGAFPPAAHVVRALRACAARDVPFKATAGLHHALRGEYPLTYAPDSPRATMFGCFTLFLAAAFVRHGMDDARLEQLLEERDPAAFVLTEHGVLWGGASLDTRAIAETRARFAIGYGSCSFREPIDELRALALP